MSFNTYWDLADKERAALSSDDVQRYGDVELMAKGVLKLPELVLVDEPAEPELAKVRYYRVEQFPFVMFRTLSEAEAFRDLSPLGLDHRYIGKGYGNSVDHVKPHAKLTIDTVEAASEDAVRTVLADLERAGAAREANRAARQEYDEALRTQNKALEGLWEDWQRCRALAVEMERVRDTFQRYIAMTNGDKAMAARFLAKAFPESKLNDAAAWFGIEIPYNVPDSEYGETAPAEQAAALAG